MTQCFACAHALEHPLTGLIVDGCRGCTVRHLSNAPRWQREDFLNTFVDATERESMRAAMVTEWQRRKATA